MTDTHAGLAAGAFNVTAHERIVFGRPAGEAVVAEAECTGARCSGKGDADNDIAITGRSALEMVSPWPKTAPLRFW